VADKSLQLVLSALSQAVAHADGLPLHGSKAAAGLFPANAAGKQAAQRCLDEGYLRCLAPQADNAPPGDTVGLAFQPDAPKSQAGKPDLRRKTPAELYAITDKGLTFLFNQVSPRQVLEDLVRVLEVRQGEVIQLLDCARRMQASLDALRANADKVLQGLRRPPANGAAGSLGTLFRAFLQETGTPPTDNSAIVQAVVEQLGRWQKACGASEDCPLPELFRQVNGRLPGLSIGQFQDVLRQLQDTDQIYLHPWTGPLYALPEPPHALLAGHEIAYYASLRPGTGAPTPEPAAAGVGE
jgi:hypothetical protein